MMIIAITLGVVFCALGLLVIYQWQKESDSLGLFLIGFIAIIVGCCCLATGSTYKGEPQSTMVNTITVYDEDNNQIMKFNDATNIEPHENRLVFYDENGNIQLVYYNWGTVIINEEY